MKDRSLVYVPPHQRLRSVVTVPPPACSQMNSSSTSPCEFQEPVSNPNHDFAGRVTVFPYSSQKQQQEQQQLEHNHHQSGKQRSSYISNQQQNSINNNKQHYNQQRSNTPPYIPKNSWHYSQLANNLQPKKKQNSLQNNSHSVADEMSEEGSDREFREFDTSAYSTGVAYSADNLDQWKLKLSRFLHDQNKQEIVSREKKDRRDFEQISALASKMGLYSHSYVKVVVFSKVPLPNYRFDLDEKRPQREVLLDVGLQRRVDSHLSEHLSYKSRSIDASQNSAFSRSSSSGSIATDEGLFEQQEPLPPSNPVMERVATRRNLQLRDQQLAWQKCFDGRTMQEFRQSLPAYKERDALIAAIKQNQVIIVSGETGCGKTTQIPQFILESEIESGSGTLCSIICTQPRRISAISVAERVAAERGENLGESVGYKVRLEGMKGRDTRLLFCTTGILLRRLLVDRSLKGITHVIVDEIHERGMNEDFLLIVLKKLLTHRTDLRLILMSATLDAELFSSYFGGAPVVHIPGFTYPVQTHFLEDVLEMTGYKLTPYNQIDDCGQEKLWKMSKQGLRKRKSQIASAVEGALSGADFKQYSPQTRDSLSCWNPDSMGFNLIEHLLINICENPMPGAVLVFMTGWDDINFLKEKLLSHPVLRDSGKVLLLACHGSMPSSEQRLIFEPPEDGVRKIVLATNIAETSITINDVVFVIDCGKAKETSYDALNNTPCLLPSWISKVSAQQVKFYFSPKYDVTKRPSYHFWVKSVSCILVIHPAYLPLWCLFNMCIVVLFIVILLIILLGGLVIPFICPYKY